MLVESLYQDVILDHYRSPRGRGLHRPFDAEVVSRNPACADELVLRVSLAAGVGAGGRGVLTRVSHSAVGCSISQASASMLTELVAGQPVGRVAEIRAAINRVLRGGQLDDASTAALGDAVAFAGVARFPARVRCASLAWAALDQALLLAGAGSPGAGGPPARHWNSAPDLEGRR